MAVKGKKTKKSQGSGVKEVVQVKRPKENFNHAGDPRRGHAALLQVSRKLAEKNKKIVAATMRKVPRFSMRKMPSGIFQLDHFLWGGWPLGKYSRVYGTRNSCKTTTMLRTMKIAQETCRYCYNPIVISPDTGESDCRCPNPRWKMTENKYKEYLEWQDLEKVSEGNLPENHQKDKNGFYVEVVKGKKVYFEETHRCEPMRLILLETENKMDELWARMIGVDTDLVVCVANRFAEEAINNVEDLLYSGELDMLFIDTVTVLTGKEAAEKSMLDRSQVAAKVNLINRFLGKLISYQNSWDYLSDQRLTVIGNSQVRVQGIGSYNTFLGPSDGKKLDHLTTVDVKFQIQGFNWAHREYASSAKVGFTIDKNHSGGPSGVSGNFQIWLDPQGPSRVGDTDDLSYVVDFGRKHGVITQEKGYSVHSKHLQGGKASFKTIESLKGFLYENPTLYMDIRNEVLLHMRNVRTKLDSKKTKMTV